MYRIGTKPVETQGQPSTREPRSYPAFFILYSNFVFICVLLVVAVQFYPFCAYINTFRFFLLWVPSRSPSREAQEGQRAPIWMETLEEMRAIRANTVDT